MSDRPTPRSARDRADVERLAESIFTATQILAATVGLVLTALGRAVPQMDLEKAARGSFDAAGYFVAERARRREQGGSP